MCDTQLSVATPYGCKQRDRKLTRKPPWGAVRKNIISDRFSTKTANCYLWQR